MSEQTTEPILKQLAVLVVLVIVAIVAWGVFISPKFATAPPPPGEAPIKPLRERMPYPVVDSWGTVPTSTLADCKITVWGNIRNDGIAGDVVLEVTAWPFTGDTKKIKYLWRKTTPGHIGASQMRKMSIEFEEVLLGARYRWTVFAYPLTGGRSFSAIVPRPTR